VGEKLNPMLYPLDCFLGLCPSEPSFLEQSVASFCYRPHKHMAIRH
jgi:hypothetical protein